MTIRKQVQWSNSKKQFIGYVDHGDLIENPESLPMAKEALVYLLTGINERWKILVAYFLVSGLTAEERAEITKKVLEFVASSGVKVIALTFDGLSSNINMCKYLDVDIYNKTFFCIRWTCITYLYFLIVRICLN